MDSFAELEKKHERRSIQLTEASVVKASGYLAVARDRTEVVLSSSTPISHPHSDNGWFNLRLRAGVETILLQKAVSIHSTAFASQEGGLQRATEEKIFPNIIIFNAPSSDAEYTVKSVSFALSGLRQFFYYQYFEWHGLYGAKKNVLRTLRKLRSKGRASDFFRPSDLYVVHHPTPHLIRFRVGACTYSVWARYHKTGPSWNELRVEAEPVASIHFDKPVSVDDALDRVWQWRRLFNQLAMQTLNIDGISMRSDKQPVFAESSTRNQS